VFTELKTETFEQQETVKSFKGLQLVTKQTIIHDYTKIEKMYSYFDEIDRRRGTNWRTLWPELIV